MNYGAPETRLFKVRSLSVLSARRMAASTGAAEFVFMQQSNGLGHQIVAIRGFVDANGSLTGTFVQNVDINNNPIPGSFQVVNGQPGSFWGSGVDALDTTSMGRSSYAPGYRFTLGYKFDDGDAITISELHLVTTKYTTEATGVPPGQISDVGLSDTFLYSPVFNFAAAIQRSGQQDPARPESAGHLDGAVRHLGWCIADEHRLHSAFR